MATGCQNLAHPKHHPTQLPLASSTAPVGSELVLLNNKIFLAVDAHSIHLASPVL